MGSSRFDDDDWNDYVVKTASTPTAKLYTGSATVASTGKISKQLDPKGINRESRDSDANPNSTPIIVAIDETGSMGDLAETIIRKGLGVVMKEIYDRKPVPDPHLMIMALGDAWCDKFPFEVTQFEAGNAPLIEQVTNIHIEGGGGGNDCESYNLPWYFAAKHTQCDNWIKRNKKGFLFTVGDEPPPSVMEKGHVLEIFGDKIQEDISSRELLTQLEQSWNVYHIHIAHGGYNSIDKRWKDLLGERVVSLAGSHVSQLAEVIVSILEVANGKDVDSVVKTWSGSTAIAVRGAINGLATTSAPAGGVTRL